MILCLFKKVMFCYSMGCELIGNIVDTGKLVKDHQGSADGEQEGGFP
jgi:hypothetical protein